MTIKKSPDASNQTYKMTYGMYNARATKKSKSKSVNKIKLSVPSPRPFILIKMVRICDRIKFTKMKIKEYLVMKYL